MKKRKTETEPQVPESSRRRIKGLVGNLGIKPDVAVFFDVIAKSRRLKNRDKYSGRK